MSEGHGGVAVHLRTHYSELLVVLSLIFALVMVIVCCLQWKKRVEEEVEEEEMMRINQMIAMSEGHGGVAVPLYGSPSPSCSENSTICGQQPPSYNSVAKDKQPAGKSSPPPPYKP